MNFVGGKVFSASKVQRRETSCESCYISKQIQSNLFDNCTMKCFQQSNQSLNYFKEEMRIETLVNSFLKMKIKKSVFNEFTIFFEHC